MASPEARIAELGLQLPDVVAPLAAYVPAARVGTLIFTSGQLPLRNGELMAKGLVGVDVDPEHAAACARICALNALAAVRSLTGDLSQVTSIVKVVGYVASSPDFSGQPAVVNGASELLGDVFGDAGKHARSAVGVASLPLGAPVEIEMIVEVA